MENQDYRIHVMFRRRNQPAFTSFELKTENYDTTEQVLLEMMRQVTNTLEDDEEYLEQRGDE